MTTCARKWLRILLPVMLAVLLPPILSAPAYADQQDRQPLLMPGKKTLFQRVITHPGARLTEQPDDAARVKKDAVTPFTVAYVYGVKADTSGAPLWYEIGGSTHGTSDGWIKATDASPWQQSLTLVFSERTGRDPALFFRDKDSAIKVATSPTHDQDIKKLAADFDRYRDPASRPPDFPVMAREPTDTAVAQERFYILPIFGSTDVSIGGVPSKILEVASIDPGNQTQQVDPPKQIGDPKQYRTAITFVLDTTRSMQPYIDRTRKVIKELYDKMQAAGELKNVTFGIVAFRNSIERTPKLEYVTKVFADLKDGEDPSKLLSVMQDVKSTDVSSHSFDEDALAGLKTAITDLHWEGYGARIILFVTDAGAIRKDDPAGQTHMNESEIALLAADKQIKIFAFHLLSPAGAAVHDHEHAEAQWRRLTQQSNASLGDLYIPVPNADADTFQHDIDTVASKLVEVVHSTATGKRLPPPTTDTATDPAARKAAAIGYALQLEFLGRQQAAQAPQVVHAFVSEADLVHPATRDLEVSVLLTRQQLSDLHDGVATLLAEAQRAKRIGSSDFFDRLASAAAQISRDPQQQNRKDLRNLAEIGLFGEYLSDLPYKSPVLLLTPDDWASMSVGERQDFTDTLESKLALYVEYDKHSDSWESFGAHNPNDAVFRVPLSALP